MKDDESGETEFESPEPLQPGDLTWRDLVALVAALGQTVLLPFLLASVFLLLLFLLSIYLF